MSAVSESIVREFFEMHGFFVRQQRKFVTNSRREDDEIDFFVINPHPQARTTDLPFVLGTEDIAGLARAVVVVKAWHTETFSPGVLVHAQRMFRFLETAGFKQAAKAFGDRTDFKKVLVVPALPSGDESRQQSVEFLKSKGIDAVLPFRTLLGGLIAMIEVNRNYQKSDLLQTIRILKNYGFFREPQLELFKSSPRRRRKQAARAEGQQEGQAKE